MSEQPLQGQIWADNDKRCAGRTLRIDCIRDDARRGETVADCTILTDSDDCSTLAGVKSQVGRTTTIAVRRFRPTSTGYRRIE